MFHVELRMGIHVVREFNLSEQRLWLEFLAPLMADRDFTLEGHQFKPRQTLLKVYEGPELGAHQLGLGRGWQSVERSAADVTERVLTRARQHTLAREHAGAAAPRGAEPHPREHRPAGHRRPDLHPAADLLPERLIGCMAGGPISAQAILEAAAELMPEATEQQRSSAARGAAWELLERGVAQLTPSGR